MVLLWPDTNEDWKFLFWFNEAVWFLDIIRRLALSANEDEDGYEVALAYIRSTFMLDVLATAPQIMSFMDVKFIGFKIVRLFKITLLHYPLDLLVSVYFKE